MRIRLRELSRVLARAERTIALLDRCRPDNAEVERQRLLRAVRAGDPSEPRWSYRRPTGLGELSTALGAFASRAECAGPWGGLYAARARELALEAAAAAELGGPGFQAKAAARFPVLADEDGVRAERWAREWCHGSGANPAQETSVSDDESDPKSLVNAMRRAVGRERLPFRVVTSTALPCAAATGDGVIVVRAGARYSAQEVRRVVLHEVVAHALPRLRARTERSGLFRVGSAGGPDDEEGRALLIERRHGLLDAGRRAELGRRHVAALSVRDGATWVDTVRLLQELDTPLETAVDLASRAHRGGGLGRELVYLCALSRVERAFAADVSLEAWLERGRVSVAVVPVLQELGEPPEDIPIANAA